MRSLVTFLAVLFFSVSLSAQTHYIPSDKILSNDWREGFYNNTDLNYGFGLGDTMDIPYTRYFYGITSVTGYQFARNVKAGIGLGVSSYNGGGLLFPLYGQFRYSLWAKRVVPFFYADAGYLFSFEDFVNESRFFANPGLGVHFLVKERFSINVAGGVLHQSGGPESRSTFINFKAGVEFKGKARNKFMIIK